MSINYSPLEDRIIVLPIKETEEQKTKSGIVTDMKKKETMKAEVIAVGQGRYAPENGVFIPTVLGKGDIVLTGVNVGLEIDIPTEDGDLVTHKILREGDILCLISKKEQ